MVWALLCQARCPAALQTSCPVSYFDTTVLLRHERPQADQRRLAVLSSAMYLWRYQASFVLELRAGLRCVFRSAAISASTCPMRRSSGRCPKVRSRLWCYVECALKAYRASRLAIHRRQVSQEQQLIPTVDTTQSHDDVTGADVQLRFKGTTDVPG